MAGIAIVGIGCRFPGGVACPNSFWELLTNGRCAIAEIPPERWSLDGFYDPRQDLTCRSYSKWGGFLEDITGFDAGYFGLSPRQARAMDPQQRLLLMVATEAAHDAGLSLHTLKQCRTGVFIGASNVDYGLLQRYRADRGEIQAGTGTALSIVANRISNCLSLSGPSMVIDTACSSSLVALDTACRHLLTGDCDLALVGGANILVDPRMFITFSRAHMLSPTGRIRAFDRAADGFVRGEGVGLVVLRRVSDAVAAGDRIYAIVNATAINQDGGTGTITEPNPTAQRSMLRELVASSKLDPERLTFAEAHGTGTVVGDPIEANAIGAVFGRDKDNSPLLIGSSKTNLGHLEPAAGIVGLIKAALTLAHRKLPRSIGYETPNPAIKFDDYNLAVATETVALEGDDNTLYGLVNSFGFGGTNASALLQSEDPNGHTRGNVAARSPLVASVEEKSNTPPSPLPLPLSAPTTDHLAAFAHVLSEALVGEGSLASASLQDIALTLGSRDERFDHRAVIIAATKEELKLRLDLLADGQTLPRENKSDPPGILIGVGKRGRKIAFTMTGQGGQWWAMGRELLQYQPVFRRTVEAFDVEFKSVSGWSVIDVMMADEAMSRIDDAAITPAVMFAFQTGLAAIWQSMGVTPDLVIGHSFGEVTAAYLAGAIDHNHVASLVTERGLIRSAVDRFGTMAAIGLGAEQVTALLPLDGSIEIGGFNAPMLVTLTGDEAAIDKLIKQLNRDDPSILTHKLALDFAYHSSWFDPAEEIFKTNVGELFWSEPSIPVISTVTGKENSRFDADYWWSNLRYPVCYQAAIEQALSSGADLFLELGPYRTLSSMTAGCAAAKGAEITTVSTLQKGWHDFEAIATAAGELYVAGVDINWPTVCGKADRAVDLPQQRWILKPYWTAPREAELALQTVPDHPLLGKPVDQPTPAWINTLSLTTHPFLNDHCIGGQTVFAGACYVEMIYAAARHWLKTDAVEIRHLDMPSPLYISPGDEVEVRTELNPWRQCIDIHGRIRGAGDHWQLHATAGILPCHGMPGEDLLGYLEGTSCVAIDGFYDRAAKANYQYGPAFRPVHDVSHRDALISARLQPCTRDTIASATMLLDPGHLDGVFQLLLADALLMTGDDRETEAGLAPSLPYHIDRMTMAPDFAKAVSAVMRSRQPYGGHGRIADYDVHDAQGRRLARIRGLRAKPSRGVQYCTTEATVYREQLQQHEPSDAVISQHGHWLVLERTPCRMMDDLAAEIGRHHRVTRLGVVGTNGHDVVAVLPERISAFLNAAPQPVGILYAVPVTAAIPTQAGEAASACLTAANELIAFGQLVAGLAGTMTLPPIWIMARDSGRSGNALALDCLAHSSFAAIVQAIRMEHPSLPLQLLEVDETGLSTPHLLMDALSDTSSERELIVRNGAIHVPRLTPLTAAERLPRQWPEHSLPVALNYHLACVGASGIETLAWQCAPSVPPEPGEVQVVIDHVGLNFRDLMAVSGLLPQEAEPTPAIDSLGLEFSGTVTAHGAGVSEPGIGSRVFAMARGALSQQINIAAKHVLPIPERISNAEAATICSGYLTAYYAFHNVAHLQAGERVLIHNGAGAVGLAAIALARRCGCTVFTTAGTEEKRAYLKNLGLVHVLDSRTLTFSDEIMVLTDGSGVDVVLNAVSGAAIDKALDCLSPYGRFLEIGKRDVYGDRSIGLRSLRHNQSLHVIDVAALLNDRPETVRRILDEVTMLVSSGDLAPLPSQIFAASSVRDAFRQFSARNHIGKIVISLGDPDLAVVGRHSVPIALDPGGSYLVTGGNSGLGRAVSGWLRRNGAGHVIAASRRGGSNVYETGNGPDEVLKLDIRDGEAVASAVRTIQLSDKPLKGIIHAAVVYDDAALAEMDRGRIERVFAPKVTGAINLTEAIKATDTRLEFFVSMSSVAQTIGWPNQANYAGANAILAGIARWQRCSGIPGQCVHWGVFSQSGHVARQAAMAYYLSSAGWGAFSDHEMCAHLANTLDCDEVELTIAAADWNTLARHHPAIAEAPRYAQLLDSGDGTPSTRARDLASATNQFSVADHIVRVQIGQVLRAETAAAGAFDTISDAGIDSLSAFELRNRLEQETGLNIPIGRFISAATIDELADLLCLLAREHAETAPRADQIE